MREQLKEKAFDVASKIVNESRAATGVGILGLPPYLTLIAAVEELDLLRKEEANIILSLALCGQDFDRSLLIEWIAEMLIEKHEEAKRMLREDFLKPLLPVFDRMNGDRIIEIYEGDLNKMLCQIDFKNNELSYLYGQVKVPSQYKKSIKSALDI